MVNAAEKTEACKTKGKKYREGRAAANQQAKNNNQAQQGRKTGRRQGRCGGTKSVHNAGEGLRG